ncbi:MAG TPA: TIGR03620 family F420-dependent LLM class oxidoreductase [Solirubrobacteraceae bacterium]|nr:TIGR03620 family F420-dependent LLM class oxidoreductase [Solirubrobacteraceae bacterium]
MQLGDFGVWTTYRTISEDQAAEAAALAESLGYGAFWLGGSPRLASTRPLLEGSERIAIATGIVNVWQYEPSALAAEYAELASDYGERLLLGIGIGHPEATSEYATPLAKMNAFFDGLDGAVPPVPRERRCASALAPKMLELSARRGIGAHTYFVPVEHTRWARELLGPDALIATELACVLDSDLERGRAAARVYAQGYLRLSNYTRSLRRFGFEDADLVDGGSDRLLDAVVPCGSAGQIAVVARAHLEAGADHVCLQPVGVDGIPHAEWEALAAALSTGGQDHPGG